MGVSALIPCSELLLRSLLTGNPGEARVGGGVSCLFCVFPSVSLFPLQIGRSAFVTSSSSLPSFPSTLSWSRDESTRRVKYTEWSALWRRGLAPGCLVLLLALLARRPPTLTTLLSCMRPRTHTRTHVCGRRPPSQLTPHFSVSRDF